MCQGNRSLSVACAHMLDGLCFPEAKYKFYRKCSPFILKIHLKNVADFTGDSKAKFAH